MNAKTLSAESLASVWWVCARKRPGREKLLVGDRLIGQKIIEWHNPTSACTQPTTEPAINPASCER